MTREADERRREPNGDAAELGRLSRVLVAVGVTLVLVGLASFVRFAWGVGSRERKAGGSKR